MSSNATPHAVAVDLRHLASACSEFVEVVADEVLPIVGARMKAIALDEAARDTGGDRRLSHHRAGRLDAGYNRTGPSTMTLTPRPLGPWALVESGSHKSRWYIPRTPKRRRGEPRRGRRIRLANGAVRWYVRHRGVRGKQTWSRVLARIDDELPAVVHEAVARTWQGVW